MTWLAYTPEERQSAFCRYLRHVANLTPYEEVCGFLYGDGPRVIRNVASDPRRRYDMDPDQQFQIMSVRGWPLAVWHSHPGGTRAPSNLDHRSALPHIPYFIVTLDGWVGAWRDGKPILEAVVTLTNDVVEAYEDEAHEWRWRRTARNGREISNSGEGYESQSAAISAARRANPDAFGAEAESSAVETSPGASDAVAPGSPASGYTPPTPPAV